MHLLDVPPPVQPDLSLSQALSLKEAEKTVLSDRVSSLQTELSAAALEAERMSREVAHYKEQEQVMRLPVTDLIFHCCLNIIQSSKRRIFCFVFPQIRVGALNGELLELRSQLEDAASVHERELHVLRETCADCRARADAALKEVDDDVHLLCDD